MGDLGFGISDLGFGMSDVGIGMSDVGIVMSDVGVVMSDVGIIFISFLVQGLEELFSKNLLLQESLLLAPRGLNFLRYAERTGLL